MACRQEMIASPVAVRSSSFRPAMAWVAAALSVVGGTSTVVVDELGRGRLRRGEPVRGVVTHDKWHCLRYLYGTVVVCLRSRGGAN